MYLQDKILYFITFLVFYLPIATFVRNKHLVSTKSGIEEISPCSVGFQFFSELNNTSREDYFVELIPEQCCIFSDDSEDIDCDSVEIIGEISQVIEPGQIKRFTLVAPILDPYERKGYCSIYVDSRPIDKRNIIMRDSLRINFDTTIKDDKENLKPNSIKKCNSIDEDPLNDCKPVNCDTYYNGKKPIFDERTRRCIEIPKCKNVKTDNRLYDPLSNKCIDGDPIDVEDIDFIKTLSKERSPKDIIFVEATDFPVLFSNEMSTFKESIDETLFTNINTDIVNKTKSKLIEIKDKHIFCGSLMKYLTTNKYTFLILMLVIFVQCCFICTMIYFITKKSISCDKKKVERKYFNYRQDVSVTTPLIGTSNIDTETTGFEYVSESSKIENKIKCYKACQKERKNDPKISMSDDILLKCLNRRDWSTKPKSDTIRDVDNAYMNCSGDWKNKPIYETKQEYTNKASDEIEPETSEEQDVFANRKVKLDYGDSDSSEKLIRSHDYNTTQSQNNIVNSDILGNRKAVSVSTEKGAQASFSNDSIDDYLSERGMMFLAGDNLSKYSFRSTPASSSDRSSKTSKNNVVKNVLSYFSRKSKKRTASDPGVKTPKPKDKDLELIHMSRGSMYSSSISEYRNAQGLN